jgi:hypothetical protein
VKSWIMSSIASSLSFVQATEIDISRQCVSHRTSCAIYSSGRYHRSTQSHFVVISSMKASLQVLLRVRGRAFDLILVTIFEVASCCNFTPIAHLRQWIGSLFSDLAETDSNSMSGLLFFCTLFGALSNMSMLPVIFEQREVFYKHKIAAFFPPTVWDNRTRLV